MKKQFKGKPVLRTPLIVAGNNQKYIDKALKSDCDCIVFDLEDGIPPTFKEAGRKKILETLQHVENDPRPYFVRVNSLSTGLTKTDIDATASKNLDGYLYTKPHSAGDIVVFDEMLSEKENEINLPHGTFKIIVVIETPSSIIHSHEIALSSKRIIGLLFGAEDLLGDMQGYHGPGGRSLHAARSSVLMACRAANIIPIDTPFVKVRDEKALEEFIEPAKELGFEGMLLISPSQISTVKRKYTPDENEVKSAMAMLEISKTNNLKGTGVSLVNSIFVSPPTLKRALNIAKKYKNILDFEKMVQESKPK